MPHNLDHSAMDDMLRALPLMQIPLGDISDEQLASITTTACLQQICKTHQVPFGNARNIDKLRGLLTAARDHRRTSVAGGPAPSADLSEGGHTGDTTATGTAEPAATSEDDVLDEGSQKPAASMDLTSDSIELDEQSATRASDLAAAAVDDFTRLQRTLDKELQEAVDSAPGAQASGILPPPSAAVLTSHLSPESLAAISAAFREETQKKLDATFATHREETRLEFDAKLAPVTASITSLESQMLVINSRLGISGSQPPPPSHSRDHLNTTLEDQTRESVARRNLFGSTMQQMFMGQYKVNVAPVHGARVDGTGGAGASASGIAGNNGGGTAGDSAPAEAVAGASQGSGDDASATTETAGTKSKPSALPFTPTRNPYATRLLGLSQSPLNDVHRGTAYNSYLLGKMGTAPETLMDVQSVCTLGFAYDHFEELMDLLRVLLSNWETPVIKQKDLANLHSLEELTPELWVDWYAHLCIDLLPLHIGLVPFDAIVLRWDWVGLCLPGVGEIRYLLMARVLYTILEHLLPWSHPLVQLCNNPLLGYHHDGFRLLSSIKCRLLPAFAPNIPAVPPVWESVVDVNRMSKLWSLYFRFCAKKNSFYSPLERSLLFLNSIEEPTLLGPITSLKTIIESYRVGVHEFDDDGSLPVHLEVDALAANLSQSTSPVTANMTLGSVHCTVVTPGALSQRPAAIHLGPSLNATAKGGRPRDDGRLAPRRSQGPRNRSSSRERPLRRDTASNVAASPADGVIYCGACDKKNHTDMQCYDLAKYLILTKYAKRLDPAKAQQVIEVYRARFHPTPSPALHRTAADFVENYCLSHDLSEEELVQQYDWDHWIESAGSEEDLPSLLDSAGSLPGSSE